MTDSMCPECGYPRSDLSLCDSCFYKHFKMCLACHKRPHKSGSNMCTECSDSLTAKYEPEGFPEFVKVVQG